MAHGHLGRLFWNDLRCRDTLQHWLAGVQVGERLISKSPNAPNHQKELYDSHQGAAFVLVATGELAEAEKHYREAVKDTQTGSAHYQYADLLMSLNRFAEAEELLGEGLRIFEHRNPESASERVYQSHWIAEFHQGFSRVCSHRGEIDSAESHLKQAIAQHEQYIRNISYPSYYLVKLGWSYHHLSQLYVLKGQMTDAEQAARQSLKAWTAIDKPFTYQYVGLGNFHLGNLLHWDGRTKEASSHFQRAGDELENFSGVQADEPYCQTWRILLLANCPDEDFRDQRLAVELARRGISDSNAPMWRNLALCHYRAGDWVEAHNSLHKSMHLRSGGDALDWLLLAMIHSQMEEHTEAHQWLTHAEEAIATRQPILFGDIGVLGFKRLAAEAAKTCDLAASQSSTQRARLGAER
jgi:tetratricopeptide (TPR) repeat protein